IISCSKDNGDTDNGDPTIKFVPGPGFTGRDTMMMVNDLLTVTLEVNWNGTDVLDSLVVKLNDISRQAFAVSGEKAVLDLHLPPKGIDETEKWTFVILDKKGNQSGISLKLTKNPASEFGAVKYISPVVLGAQNNIVKAAFISFQTDIATTYNLDQAFINQAKIDLTFYDDQSTHSTLASPGSDLPDSLYPGSRNIALWSVRNISRFLKSNMTLEDFNTLSNDAKIVMGWSDTQSVSKAGDLKVNDIWLVKLQSGKKGAILVKRLVAGDVGEIEFAIKIQE
ncbi:MAG: hypothetical protein NTV01_19875, partial [Bacteroidia bacterium]|nr:hypothetical protein [Bacteroidia bacterium]